MTQRQIFWSNLLTLLVTYGPLDLPGRTSDPGEAGVRTFLSGDGGKKCHGRKNKSERCHRFWGK